MRSVLGQFVSAPKFLFLRGYPDENNLGNPKHLKASVLLTMDCKANSHPLPATHNISHTFREMQGSVLCFAWDALEHTDVFSTSIANTRFKKVFFITPHI